MEEVQVRRIKKTSNHIYLWPSQISYHSSSLIATFVSGSTITDFVIGPPTVSIGLITNTDSISVFKNHFSFCPSLLRRLAL